MNIFISYAREDVDSANRIYQDLLGVPDVIPWLDSKKLLPGVRWKQEIMQALDACELCVVLLSKHSVSKNGFVQKEIVEALDKLKTFPPDRIFIIPVRLDDCRPQHPELNDLQWVDMFPDWDAGFKLITKTVFSLKEKNTNPPLGISDLKDIFIETISSTDEFNLWFSLRGEMRGCDAMNLKFQSHNFQNIDLAGGNFVRCSFVGCNFRNANLTGVNFEGAVFENCEFAGASLWGVNFWGADIKGILDLEKAALKYTNFYWTKLTGKQERFINDSTDVLALSDYDSFINYFSVSLDMNKEMICRTFLWINSRYFRSMLGSL